MLTKLELLKQLNKALEAKIKTLQARLKQQQANT